MKMYLCFAATPNPEHCRIVRVLYTIVVPYFADNAVWSRPAKSFVNNKRIVKDIDRFELSNVTQSKDATSKQSAAFGVRPKSGSSLGEGLNRVYSKHDSYRNNN